MKYNYMKQHDEAYKYNVVQTINKKDTFSIIQLILKCMYKLKYAK